MSVDLHIHTVASGDGEFSPCEIIQFAKEKQLQAIAITDHDTVDSVEEALYWGEQHGIEVIPGCEFSSIYKGKWLHVIGYFIDYNHPDIKLWCSEIERNRRENIDEQLAKLREAGFYLDKDQVLANGSQPMLVCYAKTIFQDSRNNDNKLVNEYRAKDNHIVKFCVDWLVNGRPYNAPQPIPEVKDVISLIVTCGGIPVLAHPAATLSMQDNAVLDELLALGIRGIEAFTTWHTDEQQEHFYKFCRSRGVLATCGSDFHGKTKPHINIGQIRNNTYEVVEKLKSLKP